MKIKNIANRIVNTAKVINRFGNAWLIRRANRRHELIGEPSVPGGQIGLQFGAAGAFRESVIACKADSRRAGYSHQ